jgi:hypothetical protein
LLFSGFRLLAGICGKKLTKAKKFIFTIWESEMPLSEISALWMSDWMSEAYGKISVSVNG